MSIIAQIHDLLKEQPAHFFPVAAAAKLPAAGQLRPVGDLPLLKLLNDQNIQAPKLPLSIAAIEQLAMEGGTSELKDLNSQLLKFLGSRSREDLQGVFGDLKNLADQAASLLTNQFIIGASILSIIRALEPTNLDAVFTAQGEYFFGHPADPNNPSKGTVPGFVTLTGEVIAPPTLPALASNNDIKTLEALFSRKNGEQYVRDLTRVGCEAVANQVWKLGSRYNQIAVNAGLKADNPLKINDLAKAQRWFKGFADYAEANVTSVVEQGLSQSGGTLPANALLAAGVATAAGTAARKASQHVFLEELGI